MTLDCFPIDETEDCGIDTDTDNQAASSNAHVHAFFLAVISQTTKTNNTITT